MNYLLKNCVITDLARMTAEFFYGAGQFLFLQKVYLRIILVNLKFRGNKTETVTKGAIIGFKYKFSIRKDNKL